MAGAVDLAALAAASSFAYFVLIGGTSLGELDPRLMLLNGMLGAVLITAYVTRLPTIGDRLDHAVLVSFLLFAAAAVMSTFPRQSFDSLLGALAYAAAFFVGRGLLASEARRDVFRKVAIGLSLALTMLTIGRWLPTVVQWWTLTGVAPPLDLSLSGEPWGHRYDVALLVVVLYPAWWMGKPSQVRQLVAVLVGMLCLAVVLVAGSRTVWLATLVASAWLLLPPMYDRARRLPRAPYLLVLGLMTILGLAAVTGLGETLVTRLSNLSSLGWRTAMWIPLAELWTESTIAGFGPGSFPWLLQLAGYFDTNSWAPRHPDNAIVQGLTEAGLLGIAAMGVLVATVLLAVLRGGSRAAQWALVVFAIASLGGNPTDFPFLVMVACAWAAYGAPRHGMARRDHRPPSLHMRAAKVSALLVIVVAYLSTTLAAFAYSSARDAISSMRPAQALSSLDQAVALDPGMALYVRQRGTLAYFLGDADEAIRDLRAATGLNAADDLAWRTLAVALDGEGDVAARDGAIARAASLQRSDVTNLLLTALWLRESDPTASFDTLVEIQHAWPVIAFAPGWTHMLPKGVMAAGLTEAAYRRWEEGRPIPELVHDQGVWLGTMAGVRGAVDTAVSRGTVDPEIALRLAAVIACNASSDGPPAKGVAANASAQLWLLQLRASMLVSEPNMLAARVLHVMGVGIDAAAAMGSMNPLNENGALSGDRYGYRRAGVSWPSPGIQLASPHAGMMRWLLFPSQAVTAAGLAHQLPQCA